MQLKTTTLRDAIGLALVAGTGFTGAAMAQDTPEEQATTLDRIEVTGSRIRQVDTATPAPVIQITRDDIDRMGFQNVSDILQNVSAMGTPPLTRSAPLSAGEAAGGTYISMRNLGAARTLVLLNGRRMGTTTGGLADISLIPAAAIERIEVLKDGASALYGSDAIGGVINLITRSNYEGAQASAYFGQYSEGDGDSTRGDVVMGFAGERGSLTVAGEWVKEDGVWASDRPYSAFGRSSLHPTDAWTTVGAFGGFVYNGQRVILRDGGNPRNIADYIPQNTSTGTCAGATATTGCTPGSTLHKSNPNDQMHLYTPRESKSLFVDGVLNITDDVRFRTNMMFNNRDTERSIAGYPYQAGAFGTPMAANSYFNPTGAPISTWWRRTWEVPRYATSTTDNYRFSGAFEGSFQWADRYFDWDVSYLHNESRINSRDRGDLHIARTQQAVGPSFLNAQGQVQCGTAAAPISFASCVPWNPFLHYGVSGPGGMTGNQALIDFLMPEYHDTGKTSTTVMAANLTGNLFTLPAGDLSFAVGVETRKEEGEFVPDALKVTGGSSGLAAGPTKGDYTVDEAYLEVHVPVLADLPFAKELSFDVATRVSDYDSFGDTTNNKFGFKWMPMESLLVRGTKADGFRAPTIADLYGGGSQTFAFFTDPCDTLFGSSASNPTTRANCVASMGAIANTYRQLGQGFTPVGSPNSQTPVPFTTGSNPTLQPELSDSETLGVVWSPGFLEGFNVSVDWWNIRIENTIVPDAATTILNDCYVQGIASRCSPQLFTRDAATGMVNSMRIGGRNAGYREVEGFDVDWTYRFDLGDWGKFQLTQNTTYTSKDILVSTNDPRVPLSSVSFGNTHRIRSNANLNWSMGQWGVSWTARYSSKMKEGCTYFVPGSTEPNLECNEITYAPTGLYRNDGTPASAISRRRVVGSNTFHDLQVRWEAPWNAIIAVGANNVFNHQGPVMYTQPSSNFSYNGAFDIGRFMYLKYTQKF